MSCNFYYLIVYSHVDTRVAKTIHIWLPIYRETFIKVSLQKEINFSVRCWHLNCFPWIILRAIAPTFFCRRTFFFSFSAKVVALLQREQLSTSLLFHDRRKKERERIRRFLANVSLRNQTKRLISPRCRNYNHFYGGKSSGKGKTFLPRGKTSGGREPLRYYFYVVKYRLCYATWRGDGGGFFFWKLYCLRLRDTILPFERSEIPARSFLCKTDMAVVDRAGNGDWKSADEAGISKKLLENLDLRKQFARRMSHGRENTVVRMSGDVSQPGMKQGVLKLRPQTKEESNQRTGRLPSAGKVWAASIIVHSIPEIYLPRIIFSFQRW